MKPKSRPRLASSKRAGETVEDAAEAGGLPDFFEEAEAIGPGIAAMDDDGEFGGVGELHLLAEDAFLDVARGVIVEIVEADFAPGDDFGMLGKFGESFEMRRGDFLGLMGMDADRGVDPIVGFGVGQGGIEFFRAGTRADGEDGGDTGGAGAIEHGVAVVRELREVDVGVGVDEFDGVVH